MKTMTRKPPPHLVRPIVYPNSGHVEHRRLDELAAINDETQHEVVLAQLHEAHRVAGITPDGQPVIQVRMLHELRGVYVAGAVGVLQKETPIEGGALGYVLFFGSRLVICSSSAYERV